MHTTVRKERHGAASSTEGRIRHGRKVTVLSVDDDSAFRMIMCEYLALKGYSVMTAADGAEGIDVFRKHKPDVVLVDLCMPGMNGMQVLEIIQKESPETPAIVISSNSAAQDAVNALQQGAWDYVVKPLPNPEILSHVIEKARERSVMLRENSRYKKHLENEIGMRTHELSEKNRYLAHLNNMLMEEMNQKQDLEKNLKKSLHSLRNTQIGIIDTIASIVELRDPYTAGHQKRVAQLARSMAREMGFSDNELEGIHTAAILHDVGKIQVPAELLVKPGRLRHEEFLLIKNHPGTAYEILKGVEFPWPIAKIVLQHHEKLDGSGYPAGLSGKEIIREAKILCVADICEAMMSHRPYRPALGTEQAFRELSEKKGVHYDAEAVDVCMRLFIEKKFDFSGTKN